MAFLAALPLIAGALGSVMGKAGQSSSDSRHSANLLAAQRDQTEVSKYGIGQNAQMQAGNLDLQRKSFDEQARSARLMDALRGALIQNYTPTNVSVPGIQNAQVSGGLQLGAEGKAAGGELYKQAMLAALSGPSQFQGGELLSRPRATPMQEAGLLEKILGVGGLVGSGIGAVGAAWEDYKQSQPQSRYIPRPYAPDLPEDYR